MKLCCTCHELKPLDAFNVRRRSKDGLQSRCRDCCRAWYAAHAAGHKVNVAVRNTRARRDNQLRVTRYLQANPCVDCGEDDVRCLDFDHRPDEDKRGDVATLIHVPASTAVLEAEIAKCDVRCANCHRRRTAERAGFSRQTAFDEAQKRRAEAAAARLRALVAPGG